MLVVVVLHGMKGQVYTFAVVFIFGLNCNITISGMGIKKAEPIMTLLF